MSHGSEQNPRQPADILDVAATQGTEDASSAQGQPGVSPAFSRPDKPDPGEAKDQDPRQPADILDAAATQGTEEASSAQGQPGVSPAFSRPDKPDPAEAKDQDPRQPADILDAAATQGTEDASSAQGQPGVSPAFARPASTGADKEAEAAGPKPSPATQATQSQHEPAPAARQLRPCPSTAEAGPEAATAQAEPEAGQAGWPGQLTEDSGSLAGEVADAAILGSTHGRQEIPDVATVAHSVPGKASPLEPAGPSTKAREADSGLAGQLQSTALHAAGQRKPPEQSAASAQADGGKAAQPKPESGTACPATCMR